MNDVSYRVALGGIVSALCLLTMFLAGIIAPLYIVFPMIAGVLMMIIAIEVSRSWALLTYISVSLLSLLITFDKEAALLFIMFFGHYPILRMYLGKIRFRFLRRAVKFIIFNVCIIAYFLVTVYIFGLDQMLDEMGDFGKYGGFILLAAADIIFVMYDYNLTILYKSYCRSFLPQLRKKR
ncbi:MAG: hypothetical protein IJ010_02025 [Ruminococcus sp.]|nr:hypothetical protein [Ruminococcus sp.]